MKYLNFKIISFSKSKSYWEVISLYKQNAMHSEWNRVQRFWNSTKSDPVLIEDELHEHNEQIKNVIACYRFKDMKILFNLIVITKLFSPLIKNLKDFTKLIRTLALHELGHFAFVPEDKAKRLEADLLVKKALDSKNANNSGKVMNILGDLLINNHIFRELKKENLSKEIFIKEIYDELTNKKLRNEGIDEFWLFYMKVYENLWGVNIVSNLDWEENFNKSLNINIKTIEHDAMSVTKMLKDLKPGDNWLGSVEVFTKVIKKYVDQLESLETQASRSGETDDDKQAKGVTHGEGAADEEGVDKKDLESIIKRQRNGNEQWPMDLEIFKDLVHTIMPVSDAIKLWYDVVARIYSIVPVVSKTHSKGPQIKSHHSTFHIGRDKWSTWSPARMFRKGVFKPIPGLNMDKKESIMGKGIQVDRSPSNYDIYTDGSGSMPDPTNLQKGSPLSLFSLITTKSVLNHGGKVRSTGYSNSMTYSPHSNTFYGDEGYNSLLETALFYKPIGKSTTFPTELLKQRMLDMKQNINQWYRVVVVSDQEIEYLINDIQRDPYSFISPNIEFEFVVNIESSARAKYIKDFNKISSLGINLEYHFINKWDDLVAYAAKSAERNLSNNSI